MFGLDIAPDNEYVSACKQKIVIPLDQIYKVHPQIGVQTRPRIEETTPDDHLQMEMEDVMDPMHLVRIPKQPVSQKMINSFYRTSVRINDVPIIKL